MRYKRKKAKQKKTKGLLICRKHGMCTQKIRQSKYAQKIGTKIYTQKNKSKNNSFIK